MATEEEWRPSLAECAAKVRLESAGSKICALILLALCRTFAVRLLASVPTMTILCRGGKLRLRRLDSVHKGLLA